MALETERIQNILNVQDRLDKILKQDSKQDLNQELEEVRSYIQSLREGKDGREFTKAQVEAIHEKLDILVMIEDIRPAESDKGTPIRSIEKLEDPKTELVKVYTTVSKDVEAWIGLYLKDKLDELKGEGEDNSFIKNLHIPAMLRLFGATNTRLDTIETKAGKIYSVPHGSHVTLKNQKGDIQKRTEQSIKDVSLAVKGKLEDEKEKLGLKELSTDTYLTTYVSPISIQTRDMSVIKNMRNATVALNEQDNLSDNPEYIYNNIAIQSGFAIFEDYSMQEAKATLDSINEKTEKVVEKLRYKKEDICKKRKVLLEKVNKAYNESFEKRALRHRYSKFVFIFMVGTAIVGLLTLSTILTLPFTLPILAAVATVTATAMLLKRAFRHRLSKKVLNFMTGTAIVGFLTLPILTATILTLPFTLPILAAVATVTATAMLLTYVAWDYRAKRMPTEANNTYLAALKSLNVGLNCDIDDNGCQEGKDRTGAVMMMREALMVFYEQKDRLPNMQNREDIKNMGEILTQVINAGHDARAAGRNTKGGVGMKNLPDYIPKAILRNLYKGAKDQIRGFKKTTKNFGITGIRRDTKVIKEAMRIPAINSAILPDTFRPEGERVGLTDGAKGSSNRSVPSSGSRGSRPGSLDQDPGSSSGTRLV